MREFLVAAMGYAALGTVADVVPLIDENRILVHHGLNSLHRQPPLGMAALLDVTKLNQKPRLTSEDLAFTIAPRLNAAGRLGQAQLGVELLITEDARPSAGVGRLYSPAEQQPGESGAEYFAGRQQAGQGTVRPAK